MPNVYETAQLAKALRAEGCADWLSAFRPYRPDDRRWIIGSMLPVAYRDNLRKPSYCVHAAWPGNAATRPFAAVWRDPGVAPGWRAQCLQQRLRGHWDVRGGDLAAVGAAIVKHLQSHGLTPAAES